jgi:hypothetical protein
MTGQLEHDEPSGSDAAGQLTAWLDQAVTEPLAEKWVPGASEAERRRLAALGGVVRELVLGQSGEWDAEPNLVQWWEQAPQPPQDVVRATRRLIVERGDEGLGDHRLGRSCSSALRESPSGRGLNPARGSSHN